MITIDTMITALGDQVISEYSEKASEMYWEYLSNIDKYDGKLITASKAYFDDYLQGKTVNTKDRVSSN